MSVPPKSNPRWADVVTGRKTYTLKFLAANILLGRVVRTISAAPTPENVRDAVDQLFAIYEKDASSPSAQEDIKIIFG